ncbi:hypothetical protein MMC15_003694 [Xylographa vitiligo]|nr:hypothetical protein [Xylographa vitiligo]
MAPSPEITDKNDQLIHEGDEVWTKIRGGKREGAAEKIVTTEEEAQRENVKNPPKYCGGGVEEEGKRSTVAEEAVGLV